MHNSGVEVARNGLLKQTAGQSHALKQPRPGLSAHRVATYGVELAWLCGWHGGAVPCTCVESLPAAKAACPASPDSEAPAHAASRAPWRGQSCGRGRGLSWEVCLEVEVVMTSTYSTFDIKSGKEQSPHVEMSAFLRRCPRPWTPAPFMNANSCPLQSDISIPPKP